MMPPFGRLAADATALEAGLIKVLLRFEISGSAAADADESVISVGASSATVVVSLIV
jgi:hypothetical protein